jgi:hypothetical protein
MIEVLGWIAVVQITGLLGLGLLAVRDRVRGRRPGDMLSEAVFTLVVLTLWPLIVPLGLVVRALVRLRFFAEPRVATSGPDETYRKQRGRFGFYYGWLEDHRWDARWVAVGIPDRRWLGATIGRKGR